MEADLKQGETALKPFTLPDPFNKSSPPDRWRVSCEILAIEFHQVDDDFLFVPARKGLDRMLSEDRLDLAIALRVASQIPNSLKALLPASQRIDSPG
jgi:hypothetical protein